MYNAGAPQSYHCTFPAMIDDWREKWHSSTDGATDNKMGFGFVQVRENGAKCSASKCEFNCSVHLTLGISLQSIIIIF